jgi:hypothetical protein
MALPTVSIGKLSVSKVLIGGNPFSGFSHQSRQRDAEMRRYYTVSQIKETLRMAEDHGVNTIVARADNFVIRVLNEYWNEGGAIQWFAQTCSEMTSIATSVTAALEGGAHGIYVHGGKMDWMMAAGDMSEGVAAVEMIRAAGVAVGVAAHRVPVLQWAEQAGLDVDFYMCSYYDPTPRDADPVHNPDAAESWLPSDRDAMAAQIATLGKPALHYKIFAGGNGDIQESLAFAAGTLRPQDAAVIGIFPKDKPDMLAEDIRALVGAESAV